MDDFLEFYETRYNHVLLALREAGLVASIERARIGCYLLVARAADNETAPVEVTSGAGPLPHSPVDVQVWTITSADRQVLVPNLAGLEPLVTVLAQLLRVPTSGR